MKLPYLLMLLMLLGASSVLGQTVSPCVNLTIHDFAPKITHASGAQLMSVHKNHKQLAVSMAEWQGLESIQQYFMQILGNQYPQLKLTRGGELRENYLYGQLPDAAPFSVGDFQQYVKQLRLEIDNKIQEVGTEAAIQYYADRTNQ